MRWGRKQGEADEPEAENSPVERGATTKTEVMPLSRKPACPDCLPYCPSQAGITSSDELRALSLIFIPFFLFRGGQINNLQVSLIWKIHITSDYL